MFFPYHNHPTPSCHRRRRSSPVYAPLESPRQDLVKSKQVRNKHEQTAIIDTPSESKYHCYILLLAPRRSSSSHTTKHRTPPNLFDDGAIVCAQPSYFSSSFSASDDAISARPPRLHSTFSFSPYCTFPVPPKGIQIQYGTLTLVSLRRCVTLIDFLRDSFSPLLRRMRARSLSYETTGRPLQRPGYAFVVVGGCGVVDDGDGVRRMVRASAILRRGAGGAVRVGCGCRDGRSSSPLRRSYPPRGDCGAGMPWRRLRRTSAFLNSLRINRDDAVDDERWPCFCFDAPEGEGAAAADEDEDEDDGRGGGNAFVPRMRCRRSQNVRVD
ncbi:hypothetical protein R3P38DRAFT_1515235 [Favolaschia claudopus]|uniref:Uncharacterized protein n=1 Tax=Favolaschia claudopus TaxID=2862362 RepID=A0AAW0AIN4_9AGAR